jgi:hypothetical protein
MLFCYIQRDNSSIDIAEVIKITKNAEIHFFYTFGHLKRRLYK